MLKQTEAYNNRSFYSHHPHGHKNTRLTKLQKQSFFIESIYLDAVVRLLNKYVSQHSFSAVCNEIRLRLMNIKNKT